MDFRFRSLEVLKAIDKYSCTNKLPGGSRALIFLSNRFKHLLLLANLHVRYFLAVRLVSSHDFKKKTKTKQKQKHKINREILQTHTFRI